MFVHLISFRWSYMKENQGLHNHNRSNAFVRINFNSDYVAIALWCWCHCRVWLWAITEQWHNQLSVFTLSASKCWYLKELDTLMFASLLKWFVAKVDILHFQKSNDFPCSIFVNEEQKERKKKKSISYLSVYWNTGATCLGVFFAVWSIVFSKGVYLHNECP